MFQLAIGTLTDLKGIINQFQYINVFEPDDCLNDNKLILRRGTKNRNAKYEVELLKIYDEYNNYITMY